MKKIVLLLVCILLTCSCGKMDITKIKNEFKDKVTSSKAYELKGLMEIYNNEDTFKYDIVVNYQKEDKYKVSMVNQNNNHEQIILKNDEEVYVVTPSLNKSFKFESSWPDNSSQSYILSSLLNDLQNDQEASFKEENDNYIVTSKVNYPHNKTLVEQNLYFDKKMNLKQVIVYDEEQNEKIKVTINNLDYKAKYDEDHFELQTLITQQEDTIKEENTTETTDSKQNTNCQDNSCKNETTNECQDNEETCKQEEQENSEETSALSDIIYPLYVPKNTYLKSKDQITDETTDRTILTFNGDKSFVLVEEASEVSKEFEVIPVSGDPLILSNTIAALSDNTLSWSANNIDYYLTSSNLSTDEMMTIAQSMGNTALSK